jgi:hypothetical protein
MRSASIGHRFGVLIANGSSVQIARTFPQTLLVPMLEKPA